MIMTLVAASLMTAATQAEAQPSTDNRRTHQNCNEGNGECTDNSGVVRNTANFHYNQNCNTKRDPVANEPPLPGCKETYKER